MTYTKIEWTEQSWNPLAGCTIKSPGCKHCYAMKMAKRCEAMGTAKYAGTTITVKGKAVWTGKINFDEKALLAPLHRKKPTMYFVNSMSDLFHEDVPDEWIDKIFAVMALCPQHTFQLLTKRADRMRIVVSEIVHAKRMVIQAMRDLKNGSIGSIDGAASALWGPDVDNPRPLPNVWLGVSVEDQKRADERIPDLLATPAAVRWLSMEPLLGPVDLASVNGGWFYQNVLTGHRWHDAPDGVLSPTDNNGGRLDWIVVGGESGPGARPMHPEWARRLRDQCEAAGVPFLFKQWGEWVPVCGAVDGWDIGDDPEQSRFDHRDWENGKWGDAYRPAWCDETEDDTVFRVGKKRAGRFLDGKTHDDFPVGQK